MGVRFHETTTVGREISMVIWFGEQLPANKRLKSLGQGRVNLTQRINHERCLLHEANQHVKDAPSMSCLSCSQQISSPLSGRFVTPSNSPD